MAFDEFEFIKLPKSKIKSTNYQYCIVNPLMQVQDWKKVQLANEFYLIDTFLNDSEPIHLLFRDNLNNILESVEIHKQSFIPKVLLYQEVEKSAKSLNQKKTDFKQDSGVHSPEIKHVLENIISVQSGKGLAMQLYKPFQNLDSCLYYKFGDSSKQWIKSGHFITISPLKSSNKPYLLELKYHDNEIVKTYLIKVQPKWYETIPGILILLISLSLFTIFSIYFIFKIRFKKVQNKQDIIHLRLRAIQSQLNPHFLFNSLSSIQSLVNTDKKKEANHYLSSFSNLMRGTLKNSDVILVSLSEEIELLKAYISLEQLRFNFDYVINIDSKIYTANIEIPPLLLQPIIENAIKHGITHEKDNGKIEINIQIEYVNIIIKVSDNGKGILTSTPNITGYGLALTKERIATINQLLRERSIELHLESSELGTLFIFRFINWLS